MGSLSDRLLRERLYHEGADKARDANALIRAVYSSELFDEAEAYYLESAGEIAGRRVLDYGCGGGLAAARFGARGAQVTGLDISHARLAEAQSRLDPQGDGASVVLVQGSAELLPFADSTFDVIVGKQILHHLDLNRAIPELVRVLRPGGKAVFLEPLIHNPLIQAYRLLTPHLRSPTERALSVSDLRWLSSHFASSRYRAFCFLSVFPVLVGALFPDHSWLGRLHLWLQKADTTVANAIPFLGRYYWQTVITLER